MIISNGSLSLLYRKNVHIKIKGAVFSFKKCLQQINAMREFLQILHRLLRFEFQNNIETQTFPIGKTNMNHFEIAFWTFQPREVFSPRNTLASLPSKDNVLQSIT